MFVFILSRVFYESTYYLVMSKVVVAESEERVRIFSR